MAEPDRARPTPRPSGWCARRRRAAEAARGGAVPPRGWSVPASEPAPPRVRGPHALTALVESRAASLPPELARQLAEALRELLLALRAVLDCSIARLERPHAEPPREVQDIPIE